MHADVPDHQIMPCPTQGTVVTYFGLVFLWWRLYVSLVQVKVPLEVGEAVNQESMFCVERVAVHSYECPGSIVCVLEFHKNIPNAQNQPSASTY